MFTLHFPKSRSKNYPKAVKLAAKFAGYTCENGINMLSIEKREVYEKWEYFNLLFWMIVDWSGVTIEYEGVRLYSHCDKTRAFYALQQAHSNWMWGISNSIIEHYSPNIERKKMAGLDVDSMTNEQIDLLIDEKLIEKEFSG
jgi:hypothetical protein